MEAAKAEFADEHNATLRILSKRPIDAGRFDFKIVVVIKPIIEDKLKVQPVDISILSYGNSKIETRLKPSVRAQENRKKQPLM